MVAGWRQRRQQKKEARGGGGSGAARGAPADDTEGGVAVVDGIDGAVLCDPATLTVRPGEPLPSLLLDLVATGGLDGSSDALCAIVEECGRRLHSDHEDLVREALGAILSVLMRAAAAVPPNVDVIEAVMDATDDLLPELLHREGVTEAALALQDALGGVERSAAP